MRRTVGLIQYDKTARCFSWRGLLPWFVIMSYWDLGNAVLARVNTKWQNKSRRKIRGRSCFPPSDFHQMSLCLLMSLFSVYQVWNAATLLTLISCSSIFLKLDFWLGTLFFKAQYRECEHCYRNVSYYIKYVTFHPLNDRISQLHAIFLQWTLFRLTLLVEKPFKHIFLNAFSTSNVLFGGEQSCFGLNVNNQKRSRSR